MAAAAPASTPAATGLRVPKRLGSYQIVGRVGQGGMGQVLRAVHVSLRREVALKVLPPAETGKGACFRAEARALARVRHPGVVTCLDAGTDQGWHFLAMDLLPSDLRQVLRQRGGSLAEREVLTWAIQAAQALEAVHLAGLVHGDVKPANLLLDEQGEVHLADFGAAVELAGDQHSHDVMGSPPYLAPEQAARGRLDERTDVYGLGATLFHLLTGRPPFSGEDTKAVLLRIARATPDLGPDSATISAATQAILRRCLAKSPADRYQTCGALASALDAARQALERRPSDALLPVHPGLMF